MNTILCLNSSRDMQAFSLAEEPERPRYRGAVMCFVDSESIEVLVVLCSQVVDQPLIRIDGVAANSLGGVDMDAD